MSGIIYMIKRKLTLAIAAIAWAASWQNACAIDLWGVYQQALKNGPSIKSEEYQDQAQQQTSGIARGELLPQVNLSAGVTENKARGEPAYRADSATVQVTQNIFNLPAFQLYNKNAELASASSNTFRGQREQYMVEAASRYFAVRNAQDDLTFNLAKVDFLNETLTMTKAKFEVGLATYTDLAQAQAKYDQALAEEIRAKNDLEVAYQKLWELTGVNDSNLAKLKDGLHYADPSPNNISYWAKQAQRQNAQLQAAVHTTQATYYSLKQGEGSLLPTVSVVGSAGYNHNTASGTELAVIGYNQRSNWSVSLQLSWDLFSGGKNWLTINQLADQYAAQSATQVGTYRQVNSQTRQDYLKVVADVSQIASYRQALMAAQSSLKQLQAQYKVGSATLVDVLNGVEQVFEAQQNLSSAKHTYVTDLLTLKLDAGQLTENDIKEVNSWLVDSKRSPGEKDPKKSKPA